MCLCEFLRVAGVAQHLVKKHQCVQLTNIVLAVFFFQQYAVELEREIALQLREQIFERERVMELETMVRSEDL